MKSFFIYTLLALLLAGTMGSCKQSQSQPQEEEDICLKTTYGGISQYSSPRPAMNIMDIFELQYGETKTISYPWKGGFSLSMTLEGISDNVPAGCGQTSDKWNKDVVIRFEHGDSLLWYTNTDTVHIETISLSPCGAWEYRNDGTDLKEIQDSVAAWHNKYGGRINCKFTTSVGWQEKYIIVLRKKNAPNTTNRHIYIYMAKVYPLYGRTKPEDYRFVFIVATQ
ncbi:MAG: hypothetical protein LBT48_00040 [Prevotellaceae bacterium]|jgi:hypothetical protein|nr:hypothetical protein [Prevotellaceae bacterium]